MTVKDIASVIEALAPRPLQEDYDNAGLQVGRMDDKVDGVLVCLDVTESVLDEAIAKGCNLVVSHHPLIFRGLKRVSDSTYQERCVVKAIKNDIAIYSAHTNLDNAEGGVNHKIAELIGLKDLQWIVPKNPCEGVDAGEGLMGVLSEDEPAEQFIQRLKKTFDVEGLMHNKAEGKTIRKVALCGGAGSFLLEPAAAKGADCFITGEMSYHAYFGHDEDMLICVMGHYQSEQYTKEIFRDLLLGKFPSLKVELCSVNTNPVHCS